MIRRPPRSTLFSLHDALPISIAQRQGGAVRARTVYELSDGTQVNAIFQPDGRSEEHTSELQSQSNLVCRLLLEKKKKFILKVLIGNTECIKTCFINILRVFCL